MYLFIIMVNINVYALRAYEIVEASWYLLYGYLLSACSEWNWI